MNADQNTSLSAYFLHHEGIHLDYHVLSNTLGQQICFIINSNNYLIIIKIQSLLTDHLQREKKGKITE